MSPDVKAVLEIVRHAPVYTAQHRAATAHIPRWHVAKVVVVRDGDWFGMAVVPAGNHGEEIRISDAEYVRV
ncbi:MAG TPA: hypothetical protein VNO23_02665, partial [Candidatus Binatia bacterium]|nr:hypothetical protein [Candidatus Binatia bacterium]